MNRGATTAVAHWRHVKGVAATFMALGRPTGLAMIPPALRAMNSAATTSLHSVILTTMGRPVSCPGEWSHQPFNIPLHLLIALIPILTILHYGPAEHQLQSRGHPR